jgi:hypothetical protein
MDILANFGTILGVTGCIGVVGGLIYTLVYFHEEPKHTYQKWPWIASATAITIACLIPSTKTMYLMVGLVYGEKALESSIGKKAMEVIELKIDEEITKLKPAVTK